MPYRHAHYYLLLLFPLTFLAFYPNYFAVFAEAPTVLHIHGATASLWILLLIAQSWTIHRRRNAAHRTLGRAAFLLFPLFVMGGLLVIRSMAAKYLGGDLFYLLHGPGLAAIDAVATLSILYLVHQAMRHRRDVHLHATYMIATILFLLGPILARAVGILPWFSIRGPADFGQFPTNVHVSHAIALAVVALMAWRHPRSRGPLMLIALLVALQSAAFELGLRVEAWRDLFTASADAPVAVLAVVGFVAGLAALWSGWRRGSGARRAGFA